MMGGVRGPQRRARPPDSTGSVVRDGVSLHYDVYGDGPTTVLLMPSWSIVDSRFWKAQVAFLARHHRVVTFDGRGCGQSDRPRGPAAYAHREYAADTVAVLDATGTASSVLVCLSRGAEWAVRVAVDQPARVAGIFAIAPSCAVPAAKLDVEREFLWHQHVETPRGWQTYSREHWLHDGLDEFRRFFFDMMIPEPHSTKHIEDMLAWSADVDAATLVDTTDARLDPEFLAAEPFEDLAKAVGCPVHVVHGTADRISSPAVGEQLAELTGGSLTLIEGAGHAPLARDPVLINTMIHDFVATVAPSPRLKQRVRAPRRRRKALYLSSPIGLGHARRDVAIATELRSATEDLEIEWLAQDPVTRVLASAGERIHPASAQLLNESTHVEHESGEHDLHAFEALRRMDEILVANFMVFADLIAEEPFDLVIADEAWEVDYFLHENPELKRFSFAWLTDFVGWLPMPDGGPREAALTADYNAEMIEQRARFPRLRDRSIFVGNPEDVVRQDFGPGLPDIREWTGQNFRLLRICHRLGAAGGSGAGGTASETRVAAGSAAVRRHRGRHLGGGVAAATHSARGADHSPGNARASLPGRDGSPNRPRDAASSSRRPGPWLRPRPRRLPRRLRHRAGAGRTDDVYGADGGGNAVRLCATGESLRTELPCASPVGALRRRPPDALRGGCRSGPAGQDHLR